MEIDEFLDTGKLKPRFDLRKLPMWGEFVAPNEINFEWPKAKDLDMMSPDICLHAIQFKSTVYPAAIASALCVLSNGQNSPVFEREDM